MEKIPLLFFGDAPSGYSGLGRILRDVATRTQNELGDVFDVAVLGWGQPPSAKLNLRQYPIGEIKDWVCHDLPYVWKSHVGDREDGILLSIWDVSRLLWMAYPDQCPDLIVRDFLKNFKGKKWLYPAIDGAGPNGHMSAILAAALKKFDRVLNYTNFSAAITGYPDVCSHGIDTSVFYPIPESREKIAAKFNVKLDQGEKLIGIVATNQPRKDWAMAFNALAMLGKRGVKARVWIHTDVDMRYWDLKSLYVDCGLDPNIKVFLTLTPYGLPDEDLAMLYSACDCTLCIGVEGWGFPAGESLACGTPVIAGSYGGQADFVPKRFQVDPIAYRYEGIFAVHRPVHDPWRWTKKIEQVIKMPRSNESLLPASADWNGKELWPSWRDWLLDGIK